MNIGRRGFLKSLLALPLLGLSRVEAPKVPAPAPAPPARPGRFGDPTFIGKSYVLDDTTMYVKRESFILEFFDASSPLPEAAT